MTGPYSRRDYLNGSGVEHELCIREAQSDPNERPISLMPFDAVNGSDVTANRIDNCLGKYLPINCMRGLSNFKH